MAFTQHYGVKGYHYRGAEIREYTRTSVKLKQIRELLSPITYLDLSFEPSLLYHKISSSHSLRLYAIRSFKLCYTFSTER
jgi:hypothetical protein